MLLDLNAALVNGDLHVARLGFVQFLKNELLRRDGVARDDIEFCVVVGDLDIGDVVGVGLAVGRGVGGGGIGRSVGCAFAADGANS